MRAKVPDMLEKARVAVGPCATDPGGWYGAFVVRRPRDVRLLVLVGAGEAADWVACGLDLPPWEHVSVSVHADPVAGTGRCPTWDEMCAVKDLCWDAEECVVQFHPPRSDYVSCHPFALHLWRVVGVEFPRPPSLTVGPLVGGGG